MRPVNVFASGAALLLLAASGAHGENAPDNGTDPTKLNRQVQTTWERLDLKGGFRSDTLKVNYTTPLGAKQDWSVRYRVPLASVDVRGEEDYGLGDASVQVSHVLTLNRQGGWVILGEMIFDTASRDELGTGKNVLKGTLVKAWFLNDGAIFAPALVHSESLWGDDQRRDVRTTSMDFYFVPKLKDPRNLITVDPSINRDWKSETTFLGLAVTYGRVLGPAFGGRGIITVKPTVFAGGDRPGDWGLEVGYKVIGF